MLSTLHRSSPVPGSPESVSRGSRFGSMLCSRGLIIASSILLVSAWGTALQAESLPDFQTLVEEQGATVVSISTVREKLSRTSVDTESLPPMPDELRRYFEQDPRGQSPDNGSSRGIGSGFIVSADGYVVTNAHVVNKATTINVTLDDRRQLDAKLIGLDTATDIALLKVEADNLPVAELGDSDNVHVGEWVLAIGSPFGLDHTATQGIVSAVARSLPSGGYASFIQTDVAVNPGNSGGPLFNTEGVVIGVNSQIYSSSGGYQGLSFAIPINVVKHIVEQLKTTGYATRGWLGVSIQNVDQALADAFGLDTPTGALVSDLVADGPAETYGLAAGDIITDFNGVPVNRSSDLPGLVGLVNAGDNASVTLLRNGKQLTIDVKIGEFDKQKLALSGTSNVVSDRLGLVVSNIDKKALADRGLEQGLRIVEVAPQGPANNAALLSDDVIVSFNAKPVTNTRDFAAEVASIEAGKTVAVLVVRGDRYQYVALTLPELHQ